MLERTFESEERIRSVYKFVRERLTEEGKAVKFILYQPPGQEYKVSDPAVRDKSLYDLHFAPSSVLLLTWTDPAMNVHDALPPLLPEVLAMGRELPSGPVEEEKKGEPLGGGRTLGGGGSGASEGEGKGSGSGTGMSAQEKKDKLSRLLKLGKKK